MNYRKTGWASMGIAAALSIASAAPVSEQALQNVVLNFAAEHGKTALHLSPSVGRATLESSLQSPVNFKIVRLSNGGWVIVSTDDVARPILAYNLEGSPTSVMPENFKNWMRGINEEIERAKGSVTKSPFSEKWKTLSLPPKKFMTLHQERRLEAATSAGSRLQKAPLLQTTWNQGKYYNTKCPVDADGPDGHVWTGCVATAMVQIMKYYNWPPRGKGSHSYQSDYGTLSANFGATKYAWKSMPVPKPSTYNTPLATIMYHAGVAVNMQYSAQGSGAYMRDADNALKTYFRYATSGEAFRSDMSDSDWNALLKSELDANRPLLYAGSGSYGGHAFVCDGYDFRDAGDKKFHFNWGWGGYYDGYFAIGALNPGQFDFNSYNEVIYGIHPLRSIKAPTRVHTLKVGKTFAVLSWKDTTKNEQGFRIYQGTQLIKQVKANVTRTRIGHLVPGTRYTLRVATFRGDSESRHVPVRFKTKGKRPAILPIQLDQSVDGALTKNIKSVHRSGSYAKYYTFRITKPMSVTIKLSSSDFDTYLYLLDGRGKWKPVLAENDDNSGTDSAITGDLDPGRYTIEATSYGSDVTGKFTLSLEQKDQ